MKKLTFVLLAGMLAIVFSAFTPAKKTPDPLWYNDGDGFSQFTGTACIEGEDEPCERNQPGFGPVIVLKSQNDEDPLLYDE